MIDERFDGMAKRVIELCGGIDKVFDEATRSVNVINQRWGQDRATIGRVLGAHLFVEHYIEVYLKAKIPKLVNLDAARLGFAQKVALIAPDSSMVDELIPGIKRLNKIRNRMAHTLQAELTDEDKKFFLSIPYFNAFRNASAEPNTPSSDVLDVVEAFALHAGNILSSHANPSEISKAMKIASDEWAGISKGSGVELA
jgi:hypothetical protein